MNKLPVLFFSLITLTAAAQPEPDAAVSALTDMQGRYTIGPWEGAGQGSNCTLSNNEPLALGALELRQKGEGIIAQVTPAQANAQPVVKQLPADFAAQPLLTIGKFVYDTHGLGKALELFKQCLANKLPADLPYEPVEESDPVPVAGAWQMITLKMGNYRYAAFATLGQTELGLWVHNRDSFVLSLNGIRQTADTATLNGQPVAVVPQQDSALIPLTPEQLRAFEQSPQLAVKLGGFEKSFDIKGFRDVVAALQPHE